MDWRCGASIARLSIGKKKILGKKFGGMKIYAYLCSLICSKIMKKILFLLMGLLCAFNSWATKSYPFPVEVRQADGTTLTIVQHGDEFFHYYTTLDGVLLVQRDQGYYIGAVDERGNLSATSLLAHNADRRSAEEIRLASLQNRAAFLTAGSTFRNSRRAKQELINREGQHFFPNMGSPRAIVILAEFSDSVRFTIENPRRSFDQYFNGTTPLEDYGHGETRNSASVSEYFKTVSFGQYTPQFDVYGPVRLPNDLATYGADHGGEGDGENWRLLIQDACKLMDDSLNFANYDCDNDGYIDDVIVLHAGYSQAIPNNSTDCIWPKSGVITGSSYDNKNLFRYAIVAELNGFPGCWSSAPYERIDGIGIMCHEFSHTMGLSDLYAYGHYLPEGYDYNNQGMEHWDLMDAGGYLTNGYTPCAYTAWEREAMGWSKIVPLEASGKQEIKPLDEGGTAYRITNPANSHEYFVLENIQPIGLNAKAKGHGLLVTHVEYDETIFLQNEVNTEDGHPRMTVVSADGLLFSSVNIGLTIDGQYIDNAYYYNELSGDPFPGSHGVTALNDTMGIVNYKFYTEGDKTNKALTNICESEDGVVTFDYIDDFEQYQLDIPAVVAPESDADAVYSIDGRRVRGKLNELPRGFYIRNGRKVVK